MGLFDKLLDMVESAKSDAIKQSKSNGGAYPSYTKECAYDAYKNASDEGRKHFDNNIYMSDFKDRYENEKKNK